MATPNDEYFDVLLVGRSGLGKSSTGNKLIKGHCEKEHYNIIQYVGQLGGLLKLCKGETHTFPERKPGSYVSCTKQCEILLNKREKVRVLDTMGFGDSDDSKDVDVYTANLRLFRSVVRVQMLMNIQFQRVLYFLPVRGTLVTADRHVQDEIKVMHHFLGNDIFESMILVVTAEVGYQLFGYPDSMKLQTEQAFTEAMKLALPNGPTPKCPPLLYIPIEDDGHLLETIKSISMVKPLEFDEFSKDACKKCAAKLLYIPESEKKKQPDPRDELDGVEINGKRIQLSKSTCHPAFIPKYTTWEKVRGVIVCTFTIGLAIPFGVGKAVFNTDEICIKCNKMPGESKGCLTVGEDYQGVITHHSYTVDKFETK